MAENNYVEAAWIQTVFDKPNRVADEIPQGGCLGGWDYGAQERPGFIGGAEWDNAF